MKTQMFALLLALVLLAAGCGGRSASVQAPKGEPYLSGKITAVDQQGRVLIEAVPEKQEGPKCWLKVSDKTQLLKPGPADALQAATRSDFVVGTKVKAWVYGSVAESYPCQGAADVLVISQEN
ncbi:MAG TPA: hypothetical protein VK464_22495 [Symbiobacteriaceae bacterium]|nr:hypothetical protein [Symbiobacteriaceae bacterium]